MPKIELAETYDVGPASFPNELCVEYAGAGQLNQRKLFLGESNANRPIPFRPCAGRRIYDLIGASGNGMLLSEKAVGVLRGFSGWTTYPADLLDATGRRIACLHGLSILGRAGPIDPEKGREHWSIEGLRPRVRFYFWFEPDSWDGSDIFCPSGSMCWFVTRSVKEAIERADLTNFFLTALPET